MLGEYIQKGGFLLIPLMLFSVVALGLILERLNYFRKLKADVHGWFLSLVYGNSAISQVLPEAFDTLGNHPIKGVLFALWQERSLSRQDLEALAREEAERELQLLERNLKPLGVIAILSPLLGLLGTVWGIMKAFHETAGGSHVEPTLLAGGIWEALITTFVGLAIAIPSWLAYYYFESKVNKFAFQLEFYSSRFLRYLDPETQAVSKVKHSA